LSANIAKLEAQIQTEAAKYEECRRIAAMGVTSLSAVEQTSRMNKLLQDLQKLKKSRQEAVTKKDTHMLAVLGGEEKALILEDTRETRAKRAAYYPLSKEKKTEDEEVHRVLEMKRRTMPRANAANCPMKCRDLVEDAQCCELLCLACGYVYEDKRCNPDNPLCSMGKFGERADVPRRRSGGYKPPNHFAEIIGHFQGTRSAGAPAEILETIKDLCTRYKYESKDITPAVVRSCLYRMQQDENTRHDCALAKNPDDKLRRFTDFYRNAPELAYRLSGIPPPYMSPMQEDRVTALFPLVIAAYKTSPRYLRRLRLKVNSINKIPNNPNFYLTFYKLCQLLGYDEFLPYIPLPKSIDNIDDNDMEAWAHICAVNGWPFLPTR
jgi:hypothetical protein